MSKHRQFWAAMVLACLAPMCTSGQATPVWPSSVLRSIPDALSLGYASWLTHIVLTSEREVNGERDITYTAVVGLSSGLWALSNVVPLIGSNVDPKNDRTYRIVQKVLMAASLAVLPICLLSPHYAGDDGRGIAISLAIPILVDAAWSMVPYPRRIRAGQ